MFIMHPQKLTESEIEGVVEELRLFFSTGAGADLNVTSLLLAIAGKGREKPNVRPVKGEPFIHEEVHICLDFQWTIVNSCNGISNFLHNKSQHEELW